MSTFQGIRGPNVPIAIIISLYFHPEIGGGSTGAWNRAVILSKIGFKVFIICGFPSYPTGKVLDVKYKSKLFYVEEIGSLIAIRIRLPPLSHKGYLRPGIIFLSFVFLSILYLPLIWRITSRGNVIYARSPVIFCSITGFIYAKLMRCLYIYEAPDLWPEELVAFKHPLSPLVNLIGKRVAKITYFFPDLIITISESAADYIRTHYKPKANVHGIPVGVDNLNFALLPKSESRTQLISSHGFPQTILNKFIVLYSGRLSSVQNVEGLALAARKLLSYPDILIMVIGEGPEREHLQKLKSTYDLENFLIIPSQARSLMPTIISAADVCTVLLSSESIFGIALPTKFFEYIACRKPLIGICHGELAKVIENAQVGRTCDSNDIDRLASIIIELKASTSLISTFETNTSQLLKKFSLESLSIDFERVISEVLPRDENMIKES